METSINNKCKAFTSLEQSKKLAEILPLESADMYYKYILPKSDKIHHVPEIGNPINSLKWYNEGYTFSGKRKPITLNDYCIPCWSLAALLGVLPILERKGYQKAKPILSYNVAINKWIVDSHVYTTDAYDNPVDACVAMIEKLHELKKL